MKRGTTKDYAGRQLDMEVLSHIEEMLRKQRVHPDIHSNAKIVTGIEKAVQRYAKLFLTALNSIRLAPGIGSSLLQRIGAGMVSNEAELASLYAEANVSALDAITEDDQNTETFGSIPDDERIVSTSLEDLELDTKTATVRIHVFITTAAGTTFTFVIPVPSSITV